MNNDIIVPFFNSASCIIDSTFFSTDISCSNQFKELEHNYEHILENHKFCNKRKNEFLAGRYCGMRALRRLFNNKNDNNVIGMNSDRTPGWPRGIVGSITHTQDLAGAAVGSNKIFLGIGIDYEVILNTVKAIYLKDAILNKREIINFFNFNELSFNILCTLIFSAKESIFKCFYPLIHKYFEKDELEIFDIDLLKQCFKFRFLYELKNIINGEYLGYFYLNSKYVCTLIEIKKHKREADYGNNF